MKIFRRVPGSLPRVGKFSHCQMQFWEYTLGRLGTVDLFKIGCFGKIKKKVSV
jgi:hypothetical protein